MQARLSLWQHACPALTSPDALPFLVSPRSLEHCHKVSNQGLLHLAGGLPHLTELLLCGSGVSEAAVAQLRRTPRGRCLKMGLNKQCFWLPTAAVPFAP